MVGYCGVNCDNCRAYRGTVGGDLSLLEQAASSYGEGAFSAKDWVCLGCRPGDQPILAKYCATCTIRACAIGKEVSNCTACSEYEGCSKLHEFMKTESEELVQIMSLLRARFLESTGAPRS
jgi:hypothetical protein